MTVTLSIKEWRIVYGCCKESLDLQQELREITRCVQSSENKEEVTVQFMNVNHLRAMHDLSGIMELKIMADLWDDI